MRTSRGTESGACDQGLPAGASALNTVAAIDWFLRPTTNLFARGMVSRSFTEGSGGDGWAAHAIVGNYAPWGYIGWLQEYVGPQWEPRSGFRFTNDVILTSPAVILDLRPDWLPEWVRSYGPGVTAFLFNKASSGDFFSGFVNVRPLTFLLENGGEVAVSLRPEWQRFEKPFRPIPGLTVPFLGAQPVPRRRRLGRHDPPPHARTPPVPEPPFRGLRHLAIQYRRRGLQPERPPFVGVPAALVRLRRL